MGWKLQLPKLIRHRSVQAQSDWLYKVTITHLSITTMTLHHIIFDRCLVLLIPPNLMKSNLRFGELLLSVGQCSRFMETRFVTYHFNLWTQLPSITTGRRAPLVARNGWIFLQLIICASSNIMMEIFTLWQLSQFNSAVIHSLDIVLYKIITTFNSATLIPVILSE